MELTQEQIKGIMDSYLGEKLKAVPTTAQLEAMWDTKLAKLSETKEKANTKQELPEKKPRQIRLHFGDADLKDPDGIAAVSRFEVWDIPIGKVLIGGFTAVFATELVDGFMANQNTYVIGGVKLVLAGATVKWGSRFLGREGAMAAAVLLGYDGIRNLIPLDTWARTVASKVSGVIPHAGLASGTTPGHRGGVLDQAQRVAQDYYKQAEGR